MLTLRFENALRYQKPSGTKPLMIFAPVETLQRLRFSVPAIVLKFITRLPMNVPLWPASPSIWPTARGFLFLPFEKIFSCSLEMTQYGTS
mmetsp:Transcript_100523/g.290378  ORF Transcript_100523/g.290378 Transcript_100523/m.290378 type:complete len:90 (+) Transcript_100523:397-666(+)